MWHLKPTLALHATTLETFGTWSQSVLPLRHWKTDMQRPTSQSGWRKSQPGLKFLLAKLEPLCMTMVPISWLRQTYYRRSKGGIMSLQTLQLAINSSIGKSNWGYKMSSGTFFFLLNELAGIKLRETRAQVCAECKHKAEQHVLHDNHTAWVKVACHHNAVWLKHHTEGQMLPWLKTQPMEPAWRAFHSPKTH